MSTITQTLAGCLKVLFADLRFTVGLGGPNWHWIRQVVRCFDGLKLMRHDQTIFAELEAALTHGPGPQRFTILRRVTDLFLADAENYSDEQVAVFDAVMGRLIVDIERQALVELSRRLAPAERAPLKVVGRLSRDDDIEISGPLLELSNMLTDRDLVEIAKTKSQAHLVAIACRAEIAEPVTDVLIDRGDATVAQMVTTNAGARFSEGGFATAVRRAEHNVPLAVAVSNRLDVPADLLEALVSKATATVRERLLENAGPEARQRITRVLADISEQVKRQAASAGGKAGGKTTLRMDPGRLRARITQCVETRNAPELIDALAVLCEVPVKAVTDLVRQGSDEGFLMLGKVSGIGWLELQKVLAVVMQGKTRSPAELNALFSEFSNLTAANAQRAVRFMRTSTARSPAA